MNILISGEKGYLANELKNYGIKNRKLNIELVSVRKGAEKVNFLDKDVFIHTSAIVHKKEKDFLLKDFIKINKDLTVQLALKAKKAGVKKFVFISTMAVYGVSEGCIDKNTPLNPNTYYGISKLEAEKALKKLESNNFSISIIRPPMIYGKEAPGNFQPLRRLSKTVPIFPKVENKRSMIYIDNLCDFIFQVIKNNDKGIYHPQDYRQINTSQMVKQIGLANKKKIYLSSLLGRVIRKEICRNNMIKKVFGDLYYSTELSNYRNNTYQKISFKDAITLIEDN
ncbi:UDP-glucose 4-epimerase [Planomicrobium koreense]|uniref:UDP-glucose 4-epimerase n=1 Tax=Planococcus koreensis TaxID=112331 RepID=A0A7W8FRD1_9BACL|nr:NAD-dependent epimerase/dehydratase family protein [Planococcus koreensis]MBB5179379.1 UDP-glucose 4-epimerase [Planococcus koreensis]